MAATPLNGGYLVLRMRWNAGFQVGRSVEVSDNQPNSQE